MRNGRCYSSRVSRRSSEGMISPAFIESKHELTMKFSGRANNIKIDVVIQLNILLNYNHVETIIFIYIIEDR